ncbi:MAG: hypothetical protein A2729_02650 [Candidatus Buchananbacteria bacterium RIFCSPHIGHO2_01_FULL_39_14]|uniref:Cell division protein FtsL n=1 Tax=Candidatus Buchananbacteria bacterium RIFCSPHIGHO2_01_FULL_39_14 TaxID=1797532 RepID=A0A1G1XSI4_9BACT|nr:MAG: hypothetical protein A2729_02650 [Candidatus Buchananbacteria bacterium RIFCSPHIGHO2_01_FULL_39_14]OGY48905.1 MAG: hypothetical protein A3D39_01300 [Candidatus Buchananbacteria bacterium RIFCSPHIGHO2_02_FULL_39_17]
MLNRIKSGGKKSSLRFKLILFGGIIVLILLGVNFINSWIKNNKINQEISSLKTEIGNVETNNTRLKNLIEYFNSNAYIEEKARRDLGLKLKGERVIVVNDNKTASNPMKSEGSQIARSETNLNNPQKWWLYFFKN